MSHWAPLAVMTLISALIASRLANQVEREPMVVETSVYLQISPLGSSPARMTQYFDPRPRGNQEPAEAPQT